MVGGTDLTTSLPPHNLLSPGKQPIRTCYLDHMSGYQPIRDQYFSPTTHSPQIRCELSRRGPKFNSLQDVKWELVFEKSRGPVYRVTLQTDGGHMSFECNPGQLSDLVSQLQSANFSVNKIASQ